MSAALLALDAAETAAMDADLAWRNARRDYIARYGRGRGGPISTVRDSAAANVYRLAVEAETTAAAYREARSAVSLEAKS